MEIYNKVHNPKINVGHRIYNSETELISKEFADGEPVFINDIYEVPNISYDFAAINDASVSSTNASVKVYNNTNSLSNLGYLSVNGGNVGNIATDGTTARFAIHDGAAYNIIETVKDSEGRCTYAYIGTDGASDTDTPANSSIIANIGVVNQFNKKHGQVSITDDGSIVANNNIYSLTFDNSSSSFTLSKTTYSADLSKSTLSYVINVDTSKNVNIYGDGKLRLGARSTEFRAFKNTNYAKSATTYSSTNSALAFSVGTVKAPTSTATVGLTTFDANSLIKYGSSATLSLTSNALTIDNGENAIVSKSPVSITSSITLTNNGTSSTISQAVVTDSSDATTPYVSVDTPVETPMLISPIITNKLDSNSPKILLYDELDGGIALVLNDYSRLRFSNLDGFSLQYRDEEGDAGYFYLSNYDAGINTRSGINLHSEYVGVTGGKTTYIAGYDDLILASCFIRQDATLLNQNRELAKNLSTIQYFNAADYKVTPGESDFLHIWSYGNIDVNGHETEISTSTFTLYARKPYHPNMYIDTGVTAYLEEYRKKALSVYLNNANVQNKTTYRTGTPVIDIDNDVTIKLGDSCSITTSTNGITITSANVNIAGNLSATNVSGPVSIPRDINVDNITFDTQSFASIGLTGISGDDYTNMRFSIDASSPVIPIDIKGKELNVNCDIVLPVAGSTIGAGDYNNYDYPGKIEFKLVNTDPYMYNTYIYGLDIHMQGSVFATDIYTNYMYACKNDGSEGPLFLTVSTKYDGSAIDVVDFTTGTIRLNSTVTPTIKFTNYASQDGPSIFGTTFDNYKSDGSAESGLQVNANVTKFIGDIWLQSKRNGSHYYGSVIHFGDILGNADDNNGYAFIGETEDDKLKYAANTHIFTCLDDDNELCTALSISETAINVSANIVPTATGSYYIGTANYYFANGYVNNSYVQNLYAKSSTANIGTTTTKFANAYINNVYTVNTYQSSDDRLKTYTSKFNLTDEQFCNIPVSYFYYNDAPNILQIGTSAQTIKNIVPELVSDSNEYLAVDYAKLSVVNTSKIQELIEENKKLKQEIANIYKLLNEKLK